MHRTGGAATVNRRRQEKVVFDDDDDDDDAEAAEGATAAASFMVVVVAYWGVERLSRAFSSIVERGAKKRSNGRERERGRQLGGVPQGGEQGHEVL